MATTSTTNQAAISPNVVAQAEAEMKQALDALDDDVKREYIAALEIAPHLVDSESERIKFLRTEQYNGTAAARRLALYWKYRKTVFGDRWLLPMIQTGTGALTHEAIDLLRRGFISICSAPRAAVPVIMVDARKRTGPTADHIVAAIAFYLCTTVADEHYQSPGIIMLQVIADKGHWNPSPIPTRYWSVVNQAMPLKIQRILMVPSHDVMVGKQHLLEYLTFQTSRLVEARSQRTSEIVAANSAIGTAQLLQRTAGIARIHLPRNLGGTLDTDGHLRAWIRSRISVEEVMSAASPILNQIHATRGSSVAILRHKRKRNGSTATCTPPTTGHNGDLASTSTAIITATTATTTPQFQTEQERRDYIRQRNALYSRRKYHKHKLEMITLPDRAKTLQSQNRALVAEHARLTALVAAAQAMVANHRHHHHHHHQSTVLSYKTKW